MYLFRDLFQQLTNPMMILGYMPMLLRAVAGAVAIYGYHRYRLKFAIFFFIGGILPLVWWPFSHMILNEVRSSSATAPGLMYARWYYGNLAVNLVGGIFLLLGVIFAIRYLARTTIGKQPQNPNGVSL
jgi:hypothetical protein